jgi:hypothetical protein
MLDQIVLRMSSMRWTDWVAYGTVTIAVHQLYKFVLICRSDADLKVCKAVDNFHISGYVLKDDTFGR